MLSARRRLLGMLGLLVCGSSALAVLRMAAWWVVLPPLLMLLGYLALLHEAAKVDAERRELSRREHAKREHARREHARHEAARVARPARAPVTRPAAVARPAPAPSAEIIELTARGTSEARQDFYDQYADAKLRAVGD